MIINIAFFMLIYPNQKLVDSFFQDCIDDPLKRTYKICLILSFRDHDWIPFGRVAVLGPVVQSIVSLTSSLRVQLVKCFTTL